MMDDSQLLRMAMSDSFIRRSLGGILPADALLDISHPRGLFIVNTDEKGFPGSHWCAFYFDNRKTEFFDSMAKPPEAYHTYFKDYMMARGFPISLSKVRLQAHDSSVCGQYCLYFSYCRSRGLSMVDIINNFDPSDLSNNDDLVKNFVERRLHAI